MSGIVVGIDFDNTIATFDRVFHHLALERGLIDRDVPCSKRHVRDAVRSLEEGDRQWQRLQASAYGTFMADAAMAPGVAAFLASCRDDGTPVFIISHRTRRAPLDPDEIPLRDVAVDWMRRHRLFGPEGLGVREDRVFFESTRADKIGRIASIGCSHFIDDLEEVLLEPAFPATIVRIPYAPDRQPGPSVLDGIRAVHSWDHVPGVIYGRR
jgi:hypothetical protein